MLMKCTRRTQLPKHKMCWRCSTGAHLTTLLLSTSTLLRFSFKTDHCYWVYAWRPHYSRVFNSGGGIVVRMSKKLRCLEMMTRSPVFRKQERTCMDVIVFSQHAVRSIIETDNLELRMAPTNQHLQEPLWAYESLTISLMNIWAWGWQQAIGGPGGGIKLHKSLNVYHFYWQHVSNKHKLIIAVHSLAYKRLQCCGR